MAETTSDKKMTVDLRTGRKIMLLIDRPGFVDSEKITVMISHEAKAGRVARLSVIAPPMVKIVLP